MTATTTMDDQIRIVLQAHAALSKDAAVLDASEDLYRICMTSYASVNVMLALEEAFDVDFPDYMLKRQVFGSIASIRTALMKLRGA